MRNTVADSVVLSGEWLSMAEAAEKLGKSPKTIEAMVTNKQISSKLVPREGRKPERVYEAADVTRLVAQAQERAKRPPQERVPTAPKTMLPMPSWDIPVAVELAAAARKLADGLAGQRPVPVTDKLWLDLDEAHAYSGLARGDLKRLCVSGALTARKSGGWRIRRASLEAFEG